MKIRSRIVMSSLFEKNKKKLLSLIVEYDETEDYEIKKEILEFLFVVASSEGFRIDIGRPPKTKDFDRYRLMPGILRSVYEKLKSRPKSDALELYNIAAKVIEDDI